MADRLRIGVLASGGGTNLQAIMDACREGRVNAEVAVVVSDVQCGALERARRAGVPAVWVDRRDRERYPDRPSFDRKVREELERRRVDLVCLAGYLRIMTEELIAAYEGRMMNIHPALLPSFGGPGMWGRHVHQAVLDYGCKVSGCTVHFVTLETDGGPIIVQRAVPVEEDDTPETLAARILPQEHQAYVEAVGLFADGRLRIEGRRVRILPKAP